MRILFNGSMYTNKPTGVGIYIREVWNKLSENLKANNIEFDLYTYDKKDLNNQNNVFLVELPGILEKLFRKSISLHRIIWNLFFLPFIAKKYNLVYSFSSHGSPFVKNQFFTVHDLICFSFPKQHRFQFFYFSFIVPCIIKASKKIVVVSNFTGSEIIKYYKVPDSKIFVAYNGGDHLIATVQQTLLEKEIKLKDELDGTTFFITVGANYVHKNVERLINAMKQIEQQKKLVIVGAETKYYKRLKNKYAQNSDNIIFTGYVSDNFLRWLYQNCKANIYISLYEGFGFPPLEAALNNAISIVSNTTALPEIYTNTVLYTQPTNILEIIKEITFLLSENFNPAIYRNEFGKLLKKYTWQRTANSIQRLILDNTSTHTL